MECFVERSIQEGFSSRRTRQVVYRPEVDCAHGFPDELLASAQRPHAEPLLALCERHSPFRNRREQRGQPIQ